MITLSLFSSPLASLLSRLNSHWRSTLRSWLSTMLLVWQPSQRKKQQAAKKVIFFFFLFFLQVVLLICARALWRMHRALVFV
jgi:hypothetical protein